MSEFISTIRSEAPVQRLSAYNIANVLTLYLLHFLELYPVSNIHIPEGRVSTAYEPSELEGKKSFLPPPKVLSFTTSSLSHSPTKGFNTPIMSRFKRVWIGLKLDLLTTYTHHSELQVIKALQPISTPYSSPQYTPSPLQPAVSQPAAPWQRLLTVEILQLPALRSSCHSRPCSTFLIPSNPSHICQLATVHSRTGLPILN
jgi:hypothetical protein